MSEKAAELRAVPGRGARLLSRCRGEEDCFALGFVDEGSEGEIVKSIVIFSAGMYDLLRVVAVGRAIVG